MIYVQGDERYFKSELQMGLVNANKRKLSFFIDFLSLDIFSKSGKPLPHSFCRKGMATYFQLSNKWSYYGRLSNFSVGWLFSRWVGYYQSESWSLKKTLNGLRLNILPPHVTAQVGSLNIHFCAFAVRACSYASWTFKNDGARVQSRHFVPHARAPYA